MGGCVSSQGQAAAKPGKTENKYKSEAKSKSSPGEEKQEARRKNAEYISTLTALERVPLLKRLPKDQHPILAACCVTKVYKEGQICIKQGDTGSELFLIRSGEAVVLVDEGHGGKPKQVNTVREGDYFGENALLHDEPRNATIKASSELTCLVVSREKFQELGLHMMLTFVKRQNVFGTVRDPEQEKNLKKSMSFKPKSDKDLVFLVSALKKNQNLQTLTNIDEATCKLLADAAWKKDIPAGDKVIQQGDMKADFFYLVEKGSFEIFVAPPAEGADDEGSPSNLLTNGLGEPQKVGVVETGGSFGELALMYNAPRAATVRARAKSVVWVIDRVNFKRMLMQASNDKLEEYADLLENVEMFAPMLSNEKRKVAEALTEMTFSKDENVITQGETGDAFFILYEGDVAVVKDGKQVSTLSARVETKVAQYFGERALLNNEPRAATIKVISQTAKALTLDKSSFELLLSSLHGIMSEKAGGNGSAQPSPVQKKHETVTMEDIELVGTLGVGAFGKVELREHKVTGKTYAVKMMSKGYIVKMRMQNNVINEKHILASVDSPFIIKLFNTSQTAQWIYFYLEPALGGELYVVYHRKCLHGSAPHARYYSASVVLAFEHLHVRHVVYRDLKPENLLLTAEGYLKLTDMGLAKFALGKTYTTCGTPEYFAPEVIRSTGQTRSVDWWTLGILIFEFMVGSAPFRAENDMAMYGKVLKGINYVQFPSKCDGASEEIIKAILKSEPSERLPMRAGGVNNLKQHRWYQDFDWDGLVSRALTPPYLPAVRSHTDLRNFSHVKAQKANHIDWKDDGSGWDRDF
jgi:cGMP-dependent protein kinase